MFYIDANYTYNETMNETKYSFEKYWDINWS